MPWCQEMEKPPRGGRAKRSSGSCWSAGLNETELGEYCRRKGLYVEQIREWREACEQANATAQGASRSGREQSKAARKRIPRPGARAQARQGGIGGGGSLAVAAKKAEAIWGKGEDD